MATAQEVQQLYIAYLGRPADQAGLDYWLGDIEAGNITVEQLRSNLVNEQPEYAEVYGGLSREELVAAIYENLFERTPSQEEIEYWANDSGVNNDQLLVAFLAAASAEDQAVLANKAAVADAFTAAAPASFDAAALAAARDILDNVDGTQASVDAALQEIGTAYPGAPGQTTSLTVGVDTLTGTADNDVFNAQPVNPTDSKAADTFSSFDTIDGGAGNDTLNIYTTAENHKGVPTFATVKNVETINIYNSAAAAAFGDASKFEGVTALNQIGAAVAVTNLGAGTTAGFQKVAGGGLSVSAAATAASAAVALAEVNEGADLTVTGAALNAVNVSGALTDTNKDGKAALAALNVTVGTDVQSLTVSSAIDATLNITAAGKAVTTLSAAGSTGGITVNNATLTTVNTGSGNDAVTVAAATAAAAGATAAVNATVSTGAGNDTVIVNTTGSGSVAVNGGAGDDVINASGAKNTGGITIDGGEGNDTITVAKVGTGKLNVQAGAGDDTVTVTGVLATTDVIDGGEGQDTVAIAGAANRNDDGYIVINNLLKNFETLEFSSAETGLDASRVASSYTTLSFAAASSVKNVGTQVLVAEGALTATAAGYVDAAGGAPATYAGALNVVAQADGKIVGKAESIALTVDASKASVASILEGDVKSAAVTLAQGVNNNKTPTDATDDSLYAATVAVDAADLGALTTLTLTGNGAATVTGGGKLVNVDASGLNSTDVAGKAAAGLTFTSTNKAAETIKLGAGIDNVTLTESTYGAVDTIEGLNLVLAADGKSINTLVSDAIDVGVTGVAKFTTTQATLDLALKDAAVFQVAGADKDNVVFHFGGDTYIYADGGNGQVDAADTLVKLVGTVDLDALVAALAAPAV